MVPKLNRKFATKQANRLNAFYPNAELMDALITVLMEHSENEGHTTDAISEALETFSACPKPVELRELLQRLRSRYKPVARPHCGECIDGWRPCWQLWTRGGHIERIPPSSDWDDPATRGLQPQSVMLLEQRIAAARLANGGRTDQKVYSLVERCACTTKSRCA